MKQEVVIKCNRKKGKDGIDRFVFKCPKCGLQKSHSAENGYRLSHCVNPNFRSDSLVEFTFLPDCWPEGYVIEEDKST